MRRERPQENSKKEHQGRTKEVRGTVEDKDGVGEQLEIG